ncbi:DUF3852 family protein [Dehalobacterium formicoaceticum]|uniref:DUF3852 domain-containing protein n=1 Tax=Dehalobacterium formicoaceticum TaxID=51515 RepID=A0ABT1Y6R4_9FIRM|nr:DUF3852 family protein [Dehalobacterium formicoaceticum]MCR6546569.1 DUF3852 domain-containing protein [Dehalobacterium formicoaceticum]
MIQGTNRQAIFEKDRAERNLQVAVPATLFAGLVFALTAPPYIWTILGM